VIAAVLATVFAARGQTRVDPRLVAVFHEKMSLKKEKKRSTGGGSNVTTRQQRRRTSTYDRHSTHPFLVDVAVHRTADYRRAVRQVFGDLWRAKR